MDVGWWTVSAVSLALFVIYLGYFWKINWVKDLRERDAWSSWLYGRHCADGNGGSKTKNRKIGRLPPVYPNGWFALLESSELKRDEVKHVAALGQNFAVFRTRKGAVNMLDAYCPHLGANMGEGGKVRGECLECPFHGWLFRGTDGRCQKIPYSDKVPDFAKTKAWDCCEVNELIFVWYHAENAKPDWRPQPVAQISNGSWRYHGRNQFIVNSHIQEIPENGADWAHLSAVHGPSLFTERIPWLARHSWTRAEWMPGPPTSDGSARTEAARTETREADESAKESASKSHIAMMRLRYQLILLERFSVLQLDVKAKQIGPGYVELSIQTSLGPMCVLQTVTPIEPLLQRVTHLIFAPALIAPFATVVLFGETVMFERDVAIWNHKRFEQRPLLVREDRSILAYRRWYTQFYSQHSPTYQSATRSLQW